MKKVGKTTRSFRYDISQTPCDYIVEVKNKSKELDLIECLNNYGWRFKRCTGGSDQNHPQEKEMKEGKMVV